MKDEIKNLLHSAHKAHLIAYVNSNPQAFSELIGLALENKPPHAWRAAWLLWSCMDKNDKRLRKHISKIIEMLAESKENMQRELMMILQRMEIDSKYEGLLFDTCTQIWTSLNKKPSIRYNAFKILMNLSQKYPALSVEIEALLEPEFIETLSPGVKHSISIQIGGLKSRN